MRVEQTKLTTVKALQSIGFETIASGDSYNDLGMIQAWCYQKSNGRVNKNIKITGWKQDFARKNILT